VRVAAAHVTPAPIEREEMLADFVAEHYQRLFRLAMLICRDPAEASDAVQHGLERAWRKRAALRDDASIRSWLDRIIVNEAIRQSRRRQSWLGRLMPPRASVEWIEPVDERAQELPAWTALRAAIDRLSPDHRAVIALHLHAGYTVAETAELVGAPMETVRSRLRVAKERLRMELGDAS
jgi:RNA polymerase sigma-70 factor, ECF subfamily